MFDFLHKGGNNSAAITAAPDVELTQLTITTTAAPDVERLTQQLTNAIKAQFINGNITAAELQKLVQLANDGARLRSALRFL